MLKFLIAGLLPQGRGSFRWNFLWNLLHFFPSASDFPVIIIPQILYTNVYPLTTDAVQFYQLKVYLSETVKNVMYIVINWN
jgi:hypothetical protein